LRHVQEKNLPVTVFLTNGVKLQGSFSHIDKFGLALTRHQQTQLLFKQAISTVQPAQAIELNEP
jgi:host factor-I protein